MIWLKIKLEEKTLDDSEELTQKVRVILGTDDVLYTGTHEIIESTVEVPFYFEDSFWKKYEDWEFDLLAEGQEEDISMLNNHELMIIKSNEDKTVIQIKGQDLPAWYVTAQ